MIVRHNHTNYLTNAPQSEKKKILIIMDWQYSTSVTSFASPTPSAKLPITRNGPKARLLLMISKKKKSYSVHVLYAIYILYFSEHIMYLKFDVSWRSQIQSAQGLLAILRINVGGRSHDQISIFL